MTTSIARRVALPLCVLALLATGCEAERPRTAEDPTAPASSGSARAGGSTTPEPSASESAPAPASASTPATPSETSGSSSPSPRPPAPVLLDVSHLDTGAPPAAPWAEASEGRYVIHGGDRDTPAGARLLEFAPMGSGWVVQSTTGSDPTVRWIAADGSGGRNTWSTTMGLATSDDGSVVAFTEAEASWADGRVTVIGQEGDEVLEMPAIEGASGNLTPVHVTSEDCREGRSNDAGCVVLVNDVGQDPQVHGTSSHGIVETVAGLRTLTAARGELWGGTTRVTDDGSCSAMLRDGAPLWRTCEHTLWDVSPDTEHLVGLPAYLDGLGPTEIDVLDAGTGDPVVQWEHGRGATVMDQVWEDDDHLLAVVFQDGAWSVVRLGLDGSMEYAVEPVPGDDASLPFLLVTR